MMELNLNGIYKMVGANKETLNFGAFNGKLSITIFKDSSTPIKFPLTNAILSLMVNLLAKAKASGPGQTGIIMRKRYDRDSKQFVDDAYLAVGRDEQSVIYLDVKPNASMNAIRFSFTIPKGIQTGSQVFDDKTRSEIEVQSFLDNVISQLHIATIMSRDKASMAKYSNGGKGSPSPSANGQDDIF